MWALEHDGSPFSWESHKKNISDEYRRKHGKQLNLNYVTLLPKDWDQTPDQVQAEFDRMVGMWGARDAASKLLESGYIEYTDPENRYKYITHHGNKYLKEQKDLAAEEQRKQREALEADRLAKEAAAAEEAKQREAQLAKQREETQKVENLKAANQSGNLTAGGDKPTTIAGGSSPVSVDSLSIGRGGNKRRGKALSAILGL